MNRAERRAAWLRGYRFGGPGDGAAAVKASSSASTQRDSRPTAASAMASPDRPGSVSLTIGELVLHGFRRGDRYAIADAAQAELSRALSEAVVSGSLPAHLVRSSRRSELDAGSFAVRAGAPAGVIGAEIGRALLRESVR